MLKKAAILFLAGFLFAPYAYAYKRAPFPNSATLQPLPIIAHPNISGNVNSSNNVDPLQAEETSVDSATTDAPPDDSAQPAQGDVAPKPPFSFNLVNILLLVSPSLLIVAGLLALKRRADKQNSS